MADPFYQGIAQVASSINPADQNTFEYGRLDRRGHYSPDSAVLLSGESEGLIVACKGDKRGLLPHYGAMDAQHRWVIPPVHAGLGPFRGGTAPYAAWPPPQGASKPLWGYLNRKGEVVLPARYEAALPFEEAVMSDE